VSVLISQELNKAFNTQIGNEFGASLQYVGIAAHFNQRHLTMLSKLFLRQADEERMHAMTIAVKDNDYLAQSFLQWFIDEQLEEVVKMDRLLSVIKQSGERNMLMVEAYLVHIEKAG
jgi:bacterioferritin B